MWYSTTLATRAMSEVTFEGSAAKACVCVRKSRKLVSREVGQGSVGHGL